LFTGLALFTLLVLFARLLLIARRLNNDHIVVITIHIVAILGAVLVFATVVALEALLHLRLSTRDDAVIMLGMLKIVLGHDAIAGALGITGELSIFFSNVLGGTANLYVRTRAVVGPCQRIATLAVEVVVIVASAAAIVVAATPSTALVLLSWPHRSFT
jgi:hypothetical protein